MPLESDAAPRQPEAPRRPHRCPAAPLPTAAMAARRWPGPSSCRCACKRMKSDRDPSLPGAYVLRVSYRKTPWQRVAPAHPRRPGCIIGRADAGFRVVALGVLAAPPVARAQVDPDPLVAPVVFHATAADSVADARGGSVADGRSHSGAPDQAARGGGVHGPAVPGVLRRRQSSAITSSRCASGALPSRTAPFRLESCRSSPPRRSPTTWCRRMSCRGKASSVSTGHPTSFFQMYGGVFPASHGQKGPCDTELLATVDGRRLSNRACGGLPLQSLPAAVRLLRQPERQAGAGLRLQGLLERHEWLARGGPDDVHFLFNGTKRVEVGRNPAHPAADLTLVAFWPPNLDGYPRELFAAREGGAPYGAAWDAVTRRAASAVHRAGRVLQRDHGGQPPMPSWPAAHAPGDATGAGRPTRRNCAAQPCHPVEFTDAWARRTRGTTSTSALHKIREWINGPRPAGTDAVAPHALILAPRPTRWCRGRRPSRSSPPTTGRCGKSGSTSTAGWPQQHGVIDRRLKSWALGDGRHVLRAEAVDLAGNVDVDASEFVVRNAAPTAGGSRRGVRGRIDPDRKSPL